MPAPSQPCTVARKGEFWSYAAGTAYKLIVEHEVGGIEIDNYKTSAPFCP